MAKNKRELLIEALALTDGTDTLKRIAEFSLKGSHHDELEELRQHYFKVTKAFIELPDQSGVFIFIQKQFNQLRSLCDAVFVLQELSAQTLTKIVDSAEQLSSCIIDTYEKQEGATLVPGKKTEERSFPKESWGKKQSVLKKTAKKKNSACAYAPATIANLSVGFDVLGLSLESIGDKVEIALNNSDKVIVKEIINGDNLPKEADRNCCSVVVQKMQEALNECVGVDIRIHKGFESGSGLGSSSASSAAAAYAYNELAGRPFSEQELVAFATEGERVACGSAHADNVAPAIMGGMVLVRAHQPVDIIRLPVPEGLYAVVLFPKIKIKTSDSRGVLSQNILLPAASQQWANMGAFVAALYQNDLKLLSRSMHDSVAEPFREVLIPGFSDLKNEALQHGALGFGISGSGPSVFAIARNRGEAGRIQKGMLSVFKNTPIDTMSFIEPLADNQGARVVTSF